MERSMNPSIETNRLGHDDALLSTRIDRRTTDARVRPQPQFMTIAVIDPSLRFDNLSFASKSTDAKGTSVCARYTCPRCSHVVPLHRRDFEEQAPQRASKLPAPVTVAIDRWASANRLGSHAFLDWLCQGCGLAARVYVRAWFGERQAEHGTDILALIELDPREVR